MRNMMSPPTECQMMARLYDQSAAYGKWLCIPRPQSSSAPSHYQNKRYIYPPNQWGAIYSSHNLWENGLQK